MQKSTKQKRYPLWLQAVSHPLIWGIETWGTDLEARVLNGPYVGKTLGEMVKIWGTPWIGKKAKDVCGEQFPLLVKFIEALKEPSVQVHPPAQYAAQHEQGQLGKPETWYVLSATPGASIVHGFNTRLSRALVHQAIQDGTLEEILHKEDIAAGDVIFNDAGIVHALGRGMSVYETQPYSTLTYRFYDYGRVDATGQPRPLHIDKGLDVAEFKASNKIKCRPVILPNDQNCCVRCLVACRQFLTREVCFSGRDTQFEEQIPASCAVLTSIGVRARVFWGNGESGLLEPEQTVVMPANCRYRIANVEREGAVVITHVPLTTDPAWWLWAAVNQSGS